MRVYGLMLACSLLSASAPTSRADIKNWLFGETIPGTEGIVPGPGVDLSERDLSYADLAGLDLSYAVLHESLLCWAKFTEANLSGAVVTGTSLSR